MHGFMTMIASAVLGAIIGMVLNIVSARRQNGKNASEEANGSRTEPRDASAPLLGEYLLCLFLPKELRKNLSGDLAAEYIEICNKFGKRRADFWFYTQVLISLQPILAKWGLFGWLAEIMRRIAH